MKLKQDKLKGSQNREQEPQAAPEAGIGLREAPAVKALRKYAPPTRWEDQDYSGREFRGSRPVWVIEGKAFAGPMLIPEVSAPRTALEEKRAQAVLFNLWHHACIIADVNPSSQGRFQGVDYYGVDEKGRHRIT